MNCKNHPDVAATVRCTGCAESFCPDCTVSLGGQDYCAACKVMALGGRTLVAEKATRPCGDANTALTFAIVGLFVCPIILEIVALVMAMKARKQIAENVQLTGSGKIVATFFIAGSGLALGVIEIIARIKQISLMD